MVTPKIGLLGATSNDGVTFYTVPADVSNAVVHVSLSPNSTGNLKVNVSPNGYLPKVCLNNENNAILTPNGNNVRQYSGTDEVVFYSNSVSLSLGPNDRLIFFHKSATYGSRNGAFTAVATGYEVV